MLHLTYSNQMEVLVAPLAARVEQAHRDDPMTPVTLVVPNQAVAQFLRFRLAEQLGVAAHLHFTFLTRFLADRAQEAVPEVRVLDADRLQLLLFARLRDLRFVRAEGLDAVRHYLARADAEAERQARALQLAGQLAHLFEEYGYSRRPMLERWRRDLPVQVPAGPFARAEAWQRVVWRALFDERGVARVGPGVPEGERHMLLADAVHAALDRGLRLPGPVHVFGLSYVAPAFAEIFARLAERGDLAVYALNPCLEFWEDVEGADDSLRRAVRDGWARQGEKVERADEGDPFELDRAGDTPALRLWGRPGREYVRLLNQMSRCTFAPGFRDPAVGRAPTLLTRVQRDVLLRTPERRPEAVEAIADGSIRLLACPGVRREVEIVADQIWSFVRARDAAGDPLRFHQVAVLVADAHRETYLTHVDAVFRERHNLPFNIIDRPLSAQSRVLEAIDRLLDLPGSDFEYAEVMRLLIHPAVGGADPEADPTRWRRWCDALNIVFGADRADLEDTYIDRDVFNWDQALRRLALGAFVTGERSGEPRPVELGERGAWLPYETAPDALADVGRLVQLARCLIADAKALSLAEMPIGDWAALLSRLVTRYISARRVDDELAVTRTLATLEALATADLEGAVVGFEVARQLLRERLATLEGGRGQHQADGVVVTSLLPMRAVPFEAVFVLGLGEGRFPAPARNNPIDLRQARRRPGDVSPAERDRYLFLETLLAARWRLVLSYVARDATTGDPREPSSVVKELQYILRGYLPAAEVEALTEVHPVSGYDLAYFPDLDDTPTPAPALVSASVEARRGAQAKALRFDLESHLATPAPERAAMLDGLPERTLDRLTPMLRLPAPPARAPGPPERLTLPLYAVQRFLESPLQGAARFVLGLREAGGGLEAEAEEPLVVDRQARYSLLREAFWQGAGSRPAMEAVYREGYELLVLKGEAPVGLFAEIRRREDLAILETWARNVDQLRLAPLDAWQVCRVGTGSKGAVDRLLPAVDLSVPLPDGRVLPVELVGRLLPVQPDAGATLRCIPGASLGDKHFLPGFLTAAALRAAGVEMPPVFRVLVSMGAEAGPGRLERRYAVPPQALCVQWLTRVITDLVTEVHDYRLPIETLLEWRETLSWKSHARPWIRRGGQNSSQFGPVRNPERFELPAVPRARAMMERRLGLWFEAERYASHGSAA